eukprot:SAG25_NODE_1502_length_2884_cov_2.245601_4_plen_86_part_00
MHADATRAQVEVVACFCRLTNAVCHGKFCRRGVSDSDTSLCAGGFYDILVGIEGIWLQLGSICGCSRNWAMQATMTDGKSVSILY